MVGSLATAVAIIAIACFGLLLLSGHLSQRRGFQLILGCFIIFGAPTIAAGILNALNATGARASLPPAAPLAATLPPVPVPPASRSVPYDPYAGASLPPRR
jgi:hypothetical protein